MDAEAVMLPQLAQEYVVLTPLANGRILRTRYDLPQSGLSELEVDEAIAAYWATRRNGGH